MKKTKFPIYVFLDRIRSLYNVGSFFRTCDATNIEKIFLSEYTPAPPRKEITKTALGAEKNVLFEKVVNAVDVIQQLKKQGVYIVAVETGKNSISYTSFLPTFPLCVIFGNEVTGISEELLILADATISIPMHGMKESLNVSVSGGIILYDLVTKYIQSQK